MATTITWLLANWSTITTVISGVVSVASVINTVIPAGAPGSTKAAIKQLINSLAIGFGHATPTVIK